MSSSSLTRVLVSASAVLTFAGSVQANSLSEATRLLDRNVRVVNAGSVTGGIPAGMVLVEGGRFTMGLSPKEVDALVEGLGVEDGDNVGAMAIVSGWYPDHQIEVADLLVDQYEFTNYQYQMYLEARNQEPTKEGSPSLQSVRAFSTNSPFCSTAVSLRSFDVRSSPRSSFPLAGMV